MYESFRQLGIAESADRLDASDFDASFDELSSSRRLTSRTPGVKCDWAVNERIPMPVKKLKEFLDTNHVKYVSIIHSKAYTAQEVAASAHIPGKALAKVVIVELDGEMAMAVLPANRKIVLQDLRGITGSDQVRFVAEEKFKDRFPDCEIGAMPPFGNLYGMAVYAAESLAENEEIAFNAGSHEEIIKLSFRDFERLVEPRVVAFTT
jgi:Ala-tRNA(Pro) deacylase